MRRISLSALAMLIGFGPTLVWAQDTYNVFRRDRNVGVRDRPKPEYDPTGIDAGAFRLYPELRVSGAATDNVFAAPSPDEQDETIVFVDGSARLVSEWSTHALNFSVGTRASSYQEFSENDRTDWRASADGRFDIARDMFVFGAFSTSRSHELPMDTPTNLPIAEFVDIERNVARLAVSKEFGRARISLGASQSVDDYADGVLEGGGVLEADDRDRTLDEGSLRIDYAVGPSFAVFVEGQANRREFDLQPPDVPVDRDSEGYRALAGISFVATDVIEGDIAVGYFEQEYDEPGQEPSDGASVRAEIDWFPDELVTIHAAAERAVADTGADNAVSEIRTGGELMVDYELRRNIVVSAGVRYTDAEYEGIDRNDQRWTAEVSGDYSLNRVASVFLRYQQYEQESEGAQAGRDYEVGEATIGIRLRR